MNKNPKNNNINFKKKKPAQKKVLFLYDQVNKKKFEADITLVVNKTLLTEKKPKKQYLVK